MRMKHLNKLAFIGVLLLVLAKVQAQPERFSNEIENFKKQDSVQMPPANEILLIGSSTFTKWKDVQNYFPGYPIINRGFGGSALPDVIYYTENIVYPYDPKQVIIYCGENDFVVTGGIKAEAVADRVKELVEKIRKKLPAVSIAYISIKPSPSRQQYWPEMIKANKMIKKMLKKKKNTDFINVWDSMFNVDGTIMQEIFLSDNLHMNEKGYAIWQKIMAPYLKK